MADLHFNSRDELRKWLGNKPKDWAHIVAARAALRTLPYIGHFPSDWFEKYVGASLRANVVSWIARNNPAIKVEQASARKIAAGVEMAVGKGTNASIPAIMATDAAYLAVLDAPKGSTINAAQAAKASAEAAANLVYEEPLEFDSIQFVENANEVFQSTEFMWQAVSADCSWLESNRVWKQAARQMTRLKLWQKGRPARWNSEWENLNSRLQGIDPNYSVWIEWYQRRVRGERAGFDIPGDKGRIEDKKILRRLAEATDEDFWGKGYEYVNATLKSWLEEARARVAPPPITADALGTFEITGSATAEVLDDIKPDPQDTRSPQFGSDATGRLAIKSDAGADQLRSDPQAQSRQARALQMAQKLGETLRNHNNAGYITEMADDYVAAIVSSDPSGLVFAGDQLREAIAKHRTAGTDDDLQPLPPSADRDASAFLSAHNMYVGSDPFLDDLDRTTRGPDAPLPAADPDDIRRIATTARQDDILAEQTYDFIVAASDSAPPIYNPADRHSRFAAGLAQNFARYGIEFLWAYPNQAAWAGIATGVGVTVMMGPLAAAGGTVAGIGIAYHTARNMIANEAVYRKLLATSPAGEDNFKRLMRFLKSLPIKSLKDD